MFIQTRGHDTNSNKKENSTFSDVILDPSASFGGLYAPKTIPKITKDDLMSYVDLSYKEIAMDILHKFKVDVEDDILLEALDEYEHFDSPSNPAPLEKLKDNFFVCELYHGKTRAFKDMALAPFGSLISNLAKNKKQKYLIVVATSGDTGPATIEAFKDKDFMKIVCLYPKDKTSKIQELQMTTERADNIKVLAVEGNFDDTQDALKQLMNSNTFKDTLSQKDTKLTAANSVNFGRIIFQIIYHVHTYVSLLKNNEIKLGDKINLTIPSGNFGNALGAFYAKKMGVYIKKINIASNSNNVLTDFIKTGKYDLRQRELVSTISPAMDILKSSNVERVLFHFFKEERTKELMESLATDKYFELTALELKEIQKYFDADYASESYCLEQINSYLFNYNYLFDTHTATCFKFFDENSKTTDVFYSTAEWTKFAPFIYKAIKYEQLNWDDSIALNHISVEFNQDISPHIKKILDKNICHHESIDKRHIEEEVLGFIE